MHTLLCHLSGQALHYLRGDSDIAMVANRAGISPDTWQRWEQGLELPPADQLERICRGLGCTPELLEVAVLLTAQTRQEWKRSNRLTETGVPPFNELAAEILGAFYQLQAILKTLERFSHLPEFQVLKDLFAGRPGATDV